jgi:hypothetical protein
MNKLYLKDTLIKGTRLYDNGKWNVTINNTGEKHIKYITFYLNQINNVDDTIKESEVKCIGPIGTNMSASYSYENISNITNKIEIKRVNIEYADDTTELIEGDKICRYENIDNIIELIKQRQLDNWIKNEQNEYINSKILPIKKELDRVKNINYYLNHIWVLFAMSIIGYFIYIIRFNK